MTALVDHLIVFCRTLAEGMDHVEARLGARPVPGGRHPNLGTHNALLGLGPSCYLEVMAPDPDSSRPADLEALVPGDLAEPRLATWVLRAEDIDAVHDRAAGIGLGAVEAGHRDNPDGTRVAWRITRPFMFPFDGVVPFLIAWDDTPHPGSRLPRAATLVELTVEHPRADAVRAALETLGADVPVREGDAPRLIATLRTPAGVVVLS